MSLYAPLLDRAETVNPVLGALDRPLAERVLAICRELDARARQDGKLVPLASDIDLKRELGKLTEQLGRRASVALPAATLGRAALADLYGDASSLRAVLRDCEVKLALIGF